MCVWSWFQTQATKVRLQACQQRVSSWKFSRGCWGRLWPRCWMEEKKTWRRICPNLLWDFFFQTNFTKCQKHHQKRRKVELAAPPVFLCSQWQWRRRDGRGQKCLDSSCKKENGCVNGSQLSKYSCFQCVHPQTHTCHTKGVKLWPVGQFWMKSSYVVTYIYAHTHIHAYGSCLVLSVCNATGWVTVSFLPAEDGVSRGAHVPVCTGHDVHLGPGGTRRIGCPQDRSGGAEVSTPKVLFTLMSQFISTSKKSHARN